MDSSTHTNRVFNQKDSLVEGWYWALPSSGLKKGRVKAVDFLGQPLALYRGQSGKVIAMHAYCPHMGAHLAEGRVEGDSLRCFFHRWKFRADGRCCEVPALEEPVDVRVPSYPVEEKYGLIWIHTGQEPASGVPHVPELEHADTAYMSGGGFAKDCHPHVVMINAIDAHHFASVHHLPVKLNMRATVLNERCLLFENTTRVPATGILQRFLGRFYEGPLTYILSYWYGTNGTVTLGPDFCHFHILFALRPTADGKTEGRTVLLTKKRGGLLGPLVTRLVLLLSFVAGKYFARGDTKIFRSINFNLKTPISADAAIVRFIQHVQDQPLARWGFARNTTDPKDSEEGVEEIVRTWALPVRSSPAEPVA